MPWLLTTGRNPGVGEQRRSATRRRVGASGGLARWLYTQWLYTQPATFLTSS
jgi:hypothetical protein